MLRQTIQAQQAQKQLDLPRRPAAASLYAVLGISSQLLADITSGVTGVNAVCTVKI